MPNRTASAIASLLLVGSLGCESAPAEPDPELTVSLCVQFINATNGSNVVWSVADRNGDPALEVAGLKVGSLTQGASIVLQARKGFLTGYGPFSFSAGAQAGILGNLSCKISGGNSITTSPFHDVEATPTGVICRPHQPQATINNAECS